MFGNLLKKLVAPQMWLSSNQLSRESPLQMVSDGSRW